MSPDRPPPFFVGDHLAIDFLNTIAAPHGKEIDWLLDGEDLIAWLEKADMIDSKNGQKMRVSNAKILREVVQQARTFRKWLRGFVTSRAGKHLRTTTSAIAPVNELLERDNSFERMELPSRGQETDRKPLLRRLPRWESPEELLLPIAEAVADLICYQDFQSIRICEGTGCILIFLDRTKAQSRRWCSMAICGNRFKVAAHRAKHSKREKK